MNLHWNSKHSFLPDQRWLQECDEDFSMSLAEIRQLMEDSKEDGKVNWFRFNALAILLMAKRVYGIDG